MAASSGAHVLEIRRGEGAPASMDLYPGRPVDPISIGTQGQWCLDAAGVLDVHAYVYWDGHALFVQSAEGLSPVLVNGRRVGIDWSEIQAPSTIMIGEARIVFCTAEEARPQAAAKNAPVSDSPSSEEETQAVLPRVIPPSPIVPSFEAPKAAAGPPTTSPFAANAHAGPPKTSPFAGAPPQTAPMFAPGPAPKADDESTKILPIPMLMPQPIATAPKKQPASIAPPPQPALPQEPSPNPPPSVVVAPPEPTAKITLPANAQATQVTKPQTKFQAFLISLRAQWHATSLPKKIILVLLPLGFIMVWVAFNDDGQARTAPRPKASASASSAKVANKAPPPPSTTEDVAPVPPPVSTTTDSAPTPTATIPTPPPVPTGTNNPDAGIAKTLERAAADAVAAGAYAEAIRDYDELAREQPENPTWPTAAKILRQKLAAQSQQGK